MYIVAKVLYFDKEYPADGNLTNRFEEVNRYEDITSAIAKRDFLRQTLSNVGNKETTAIDYVVYLLNSQLYEVKAITSTTMQVSPNGYTKPYAYSVPLEVAESMCNFFNSRHENYSPEINTLENNPVKLVMFPSGKFTTIDVPDA